MIDLRSDTVTRPTGAMRRVMFKAAIGEAGGFLQALKREGVLATPRGKGAIRMCTHLDVGDEEIDAAVEVASRLAVRPLER